MRRYRIFQPQPLTQNQVIELDEAGSRHLGTVLRVQIGEPVCVFNGDGNEAFGQVLSVGKRQVQVQILDLHPVSRASPLQTHLGQVISRGERMEYALQKAVELGVSRITPLYSEHGEVRLSAERQDKRLKQWEHLLISACEQCGLNRIPVLHTPQTVTDWFEKTQAQLKWLLHPEGGQVPDWSQPAPDSVALTIGPEGGFSDSEVTLGRYAGFTCLSLGPRILRTETAPVVCLSLLQAAWGDLN
jgi:16S rRNA (uracil1498-N3)-methyltransferase